MASTHNWGLIGHDWAVSLLSQHISKQRIRHAYLLTGPQGIGRRTLAVAFTQALNCPQPLSPGQPCQECKTCTRIHALSYPDLDIVQSEQVGSQLKIEQVRELQRRLALSPYEGNYRVALLLRFEEANINTSNALLKTLEEPNPRVVLILTASDAESLNPTIVSRCEVLRLRPLPIDAAAASLQEYLNTTPEQALLLAHISNGRPGLAVNYHHNLEHRKNRQDPLNHLFHLLTGSRLERFNFAGTLNKEWRDGNKELTFNQLMIGMSFWRDVLLRVSGSVTPITNLDCSPQIDILAAQVDVSTVYRIIRQYEETVRLLMSNVNQRLALEVLFLDLPHIQENLAELPGMEA